MKLKILIATTIAIFLAVCKNIFKSLKELLV